MEAGSRVFNAAVQRRRGLGSGNKATSSGFVGWALPTIQYHGGQSPPYEFVFLCVLGVLAPLR